MDENTVNTFPSRGQICANLAVYGTAHTAVDATCAGILFTLWNRDVLSTTELGWYFFLYNLLAFGMQPVLGLALDRLRRPRSAAMAGCLLTALATTGFAQRPLLAICVAGVGNALFHLGAGSICLNLTPGRAVAPGMFVAPGAAGLFLGTLQGRNDAFESLPFLVLLAVCCVAMRVLPLPALDYRREQAPSQPRWSWAVLCLLLLCIGVRSTVGFGIVLPWNEGMGWPLALTGFVVMGKGLGGVMADWLGWGRVAVGALALAAPLLAFGANEPSAAITGMFLFNLPMAVTLVAGANLLPGRPAFAFGLTCLALEAGAWIIMLPPGSERVIDSEWLVFGAVFAAAAVLYLTLQAAFLRLAPRFARVRL